MNFNISQVLNDVNIFIPIIEKLAPFLDMIYFADPVFLSESDAHVLKLRVRVSNATSSHLDDHQPNNYPYVL